MPSRWKSGDRSLSGGGLLDEASPGSPSRVITFRTPTACAPAARYPGRRRGGQMPPANRQLAYKHGSMEAWKPILVQDLPKRNMADRLPVLFAAAEREILTGDVRGGTPVDAGPWSAPEEQSAGKWLLC
jgi:hypothetical protein